MDVLETGLLVLMGLLVVAGGSVAVAAARPGADPRQVAARALGILGALALGAGTILFFAANWSDIPRPLRFAILLGGLAAAYVAAVWLLEVRRERPNVAHGLVLVGTVLFGASIFLVGQTYHVQAHEPLAFLAWSAGALGTALYFRSPPAAGLALLTFEAWLVYELADYRGWDGARYLPFVLALYGVTLYTLGTAARPWLAPLKVDGAMRVIGFSLAAFLTLALSFPYAHLHERRPTGLPLWMIAVSAGVAFVSAALLAARLRGLALLEPLVAAAAAILVLVAALAPQRPDDDALYNEALFDFSRRLFPALFAVLLVALVVGAVLLGSLREQLWLSTTAILVGSLGVLLHFLDLSWGRLPRSFVFLGVGALILGLAAALERRVERAR